MSGFPGLVSATDSLGDAGPAPAFVARRQHFERTSSTNDVIRTWLAEGTAEVCLATADEQSAGRGREGRSWIAPSGAGLLLSLGFRPSWLAPERVWQLAATASLAMADAAEGLARLPSLAILVKWPNDLVVVYGGPDDPRPGVLRKLAGVLGETDGLGTADPTAVVGLGINVDWRAEAFPAELAPFMTSLREASGGRPPTRRALLGAFLVGLEQRIVALRDGHFDGPGWERRQATTGRDIRLELPDRSVEVVRALGVDPDAGALVVADPAAPAGSRRVFSGEIRHVRLMAADGSRV
jgi:BirA family biotin operon repressor/biotin-[acetyl-CoA-carboxylase] ligase